MDQLVKRRAKSGLIRVKVDWNSAKEFVTEHLDKEIKVTIYYIYFLTNFIMDLEIITKLKLLKYRCTFTSKKLFCGVLAHT